MAGSIATAFVQILPSFEGLSARLREGFASAGAVGEEAGAKLAAGLGGGVAGAAARVRTSLGETVATAGTVGEQAGARLAAGLGEGGTAGAARVRAGIEESAAAAGAAGREAGTRLAAGIGDGGAEGAAHARASLAEVGAAGRAAGEEARAGFAEFGDQIKELGKTFAEFFVIEKIAEFAKESIEAGENVERVSNLIEQQIEATGGAAGVSAAQVQKLATGISDSAGVARTQILLAEQGLLRFGNVADKAGTGNDIFTRASQDAADLAAVMHTTVPAAATLLGKALNNPTVGLTRLTRAGVSFTAQQTAQIKTLTNSGHLLEAQGIILDHFESQFSGAATAATTPLDRLKSSVSNLQSSLGQALLPILDAGITKLANLATQASDAAEGGLTKLSAAFEALSSHSDIDLAKALGVGAGSTLITILDQVRDAAVGIGAAGTKAFDDLKPGLEAFARQAAITAGELGGGLLIAVEGLAKALDPLAKVLSSVLGFAASHGTAFTALAIGGLAFAAALKAITIASKGGAILSDLQVAFVGTERSVAGLRSSFSTLGSSESGALKGIAGLGTAALGPIGAVAGVAALAGAGISLLVKNYENGKAQVQAFTSAILADNDTIGAQTKVTAAQQIVSSGAASDAAKLGISYGLISQAAIGSVPAQQQLNAVLGQFRDAGSAASRQAFDSGTALSALGQTTVETAGTAQELGSEIGGVEKRLGTSKASADATSKVYRALGLNADGSAKSVGKLGEGVGATGDAADGATPKVAVLSAAQLALNAATKAYQSALSGLDSRLSAILSHFQGLGGAEDQLTTDTLALAASVKQNGKDFDGSSAKAIANRTALRTVGSDYEAFADQVAKSGKPLKEQQGLLNGRRDDLLSYARSLGLSGPQLAAFTKELQALDVNAQQPAIKKAKVDLDKAGLASSTGAVNAFTQKTLGNVPAVTKAAITVTGIPPATGAVNAFVQKSLGSIPAAKSTAISESGADAAAASIRTLHENEDALYDKTITITAVEKVKKSAAFSGAGPQTPSVSAGGGLGIDAAGGGSLVDVERYVSAFKTLADAFGPTLVRGLTGTADSISSTLATLGHDLASAYFSVGKTIASTQASVTKSKKSIADLEALKKPTAAQTKALGVAQDKLREEEKELSDLKNLPPESRLATILRRDGKQLQGLAKARDALAGLLTTAQGKLKDAIDAKASDEASFASGIVNGDNLIGDATLTASGSAAAAAVTAAATASETARQKVLADRVAETAAIKNTATAQAALDALRRSGRGTADDLTNAERALAAAQAISQKATAQTAKDSGGLTAARTAQAAATRAVPRLELAAFVKTDQDNAKTAALFRTQLASLEKRGVDKTLLSQLISAGPAASEEQAAYLSQATPAQLKAINVAQASINKSAADAAAAAATYLDQAAIDRNQATVNLLTRQEHTAEENLAALAKRLQQQFTKALAEAAGTAVADAGRRITPAAAAPKSDATTHQQIHIVATDPHAVATAIVTLQRRQGILGRVRTVR